MKPDYEEVQIAFNKIQSHVYFDNYDLMLRKRVAIFKTKIDSNINRFLSEFNLRTPFDELLRKQVNLTFLPKKIVSHDSSPNFYTNTRVLEDNTISKPNIHCDFPVEFHLISTIWLMRYGGFLDKKFSDDSYGNRLIVNHQTGELDGRSLFKPYFRQFQNWWSKSIQKTKEDLDNGENVTIINFDLQSFYHKVRYSFDKLEKSLQKAFPEIKEDIVHILLKEIHIRYREVLSAKVNISPSERYFPLPIGLFTSHIFANQHLIELDRFIKREMNPVHYGRYVDDILIVVKNTVLDRATIQKGLNSKDRSELARLYLTKYFTKLFDTSNSKTIEFKLSRLKHLKLNMEKLFIYQFDAKHSPNLIERFVEDQKERASMFRFLSDEEDEYFEDFEEQTFESNFEHVDLNKARFKNIEDNKYKLSSFLSKMIRRRIEKGEGYKEDEILKIDKYFKGSYLIKHYYFWEKLLTLYVIYQRPDLIIKLLNSILNEIELIEVQHNEDYKIEIKDYKKTLKAFLNNALAMSIGLNINIVNDNQVLKTALLNLLISLEASNLNNSEYDSKLKRKLLVFKRSGLLRGAFIYYPLLQFTNLSRHNDIDLTSPKSIFSLLENPNQVRNPFEIRNHKFIPFRIKFWQASLLTYYENIFELRPEVRDRMLQTDKFFTFNILNKAFDLFYSINKPRTPKRILKLQYFKINKTDKRKKGKLVPPKERSKNYYIQEVQVPYKGESIESYRIALINKYVDSNDFISSLEGHPNQNHERMGVFDQILDEVSKIKNCHMFVMPELSLPHQLISKYVDQSARKQISVVTGVEHMNVYDIGFNFVLTVLPITVDGDKDAIPILRLKNHYAPEEEECIWDVDHRKRNLYVPKPTPYRYDLFEWRGLYFSTYYCYELADVFHRSIFFSQVDVIIVPVWNVDTHYYNSIVDAATRDMHNYFVIVNTSQYGFSKIARPKDHVNKEKIIVKGGTENDYGFTVLVGDLKIKELREFQLLSYPEQQALRKELKKKNKSPYKPTPPDFPIENVQKRIDNEPFYK